MATTPPLPPGSMPPPMSYPQHKPSWWSRNWKWFVPTLIFVIFVLPLGACGGIVYIVMSSLKNSEVARESFARAQSNPAVIEKLGTPMQMGMWAGGSINVAPADGRAELVIPISGPKGKGVLAVSAIKTAGEWHYKVMKVSVEGGSRVDLLNEAEQKGPRELEIPSDSSTPEPSSN